MFRNCDLLRFRSLIEGSKIEKNAKMSVPRLEPLQTRPKGSQIELPSKVEKSWEASAQDHTNLAIKRHLNQ